MPNKCFVVVCNSGYKDGPNYRQVFRPWEPFRCTGCLKIIAVLYLDQL